MRAAELPATMCFSIGRHVVIGCLSMPPPILVNVDKDTLFSASRCAAWRVNDRVL
jgi:hypothetical protein